LQSVPTSALSSLNMLKKLEMQENQISDIVEGDFEGLSKFNSDYDCVVNTHLTDILLCAFSTRTKLSAINAQFHAVIRRII